MIAIDWTYLTEEFVRYGLYFGAVFQLICIGAAIFLPSKSDSCSGGGGGGDRGLGSPTAVDSDTETEDLQAGGSGGHTAASTINTGGRPVTRSRRQTQQQPAELETQKISGTSRQQLKGRGERKKRR